MGIEFRNRKEIDAIVRDERYIYTFSDTIGFVRRRI